MARYGTWKPLGSDPAHQPLMSKHDLVVLHTMVGSLEGTYGYFEQDGYVGVESHFGVGYDGTVWQFTDTARTADACLDSNYRAISIETADRGTGFPDWDPNGSNVPAWLPAQIDALAELVAWACKTHDIPCVLVHDNLPGTRGISYHRLGIDSSPPFQHGWRTSGSEHMSESVGKVCPGDRRIAQIPEVIAKAKDILDGQDKPVWKWPQLWLAQKAVGTAIRILDPFVKAHPAMKGIATALTELRSAWLKIHAPNKKV